MSFYVPSASPPSLFFKSHRKRNNNIRNLKAWAEVKGTPFLTHTSLYGWLRLWDIGGYGYGVDFGADLGIIAAKKCGLQGCVERGMG